METKKIINSPLARWLHYGLTALVFSALISCSMQKMLVRQMKPVLLNSAQALYEEDDLPIAEQSLASNLKLIDGLLKSDPQNEELLLLAAQGYAGYALAFAEDKDPQRAKKLYLRARDYALKILRKDKRFKQAEQQGDLELQRVVDQYGKNKSAALFWAGFSWAGYALLSMDDPQALADFATIEIFMHRVEEINPEYFHGAVWLFWGAYYGMIPKMLGGDPAKSLQYFERNIRLNHGNFLLAYVYAARFYAAKILDEKKFDEYLDHIENTPSDVEKELTFLNQVAKQKARLLKQQKSERF